MDTIHIQSFVSAAPAEVWAVLLGRPDLVLDALPMDAWPEQRREKAPHNLVCQWSCTHEPTVVELTLNDLPGGTRVDLKHGGWDDGPEWEAELQGHFAGWLQGLAALGLLVESGKDARVSRADLAGKDRYFISGEIPAPVAAVYRSLTDAQVLERWSSGAFDAADLLDAVEDHYVRWRLPGGELVVILRRTPRGTHCALAEYGVADRTASQRWPAMFERLARFLG